MPLTEIGKHVVAAIDLAGGATNVATHAAQLAAMNKATLHLVHVIEPAPSSLRRMLGKKDLMVHRRRLREEARARMTTIAEGLAAKGQKVEVYVGNGKASKEVLNISAELKAGLIVAGAGVTEGTEWLFVGTTADRLIRNSKVPVLIVGTEGVHQLKRILVPTDFDRPDQGALRVACKIAMQSRGRVSLLHAFSQPSILHGYSGNVAALRREAKAHAKEEFDSFVKKTKLPEGSKTPHKILKACTDGVDAAEAIIADAMRLDMDIIVMALGGISFLESFMIGAVAERVIRNLPCSFLALPQAWAKRR